MIAEAHAEVMVYTDAALLFEDDLMRWTFQALKTDYYSAQKLKAVAH